MINKILIGSDEGAYTVTNGARTITLTGLSFTPLIEQLAYVYNKTQDKLYYAPAEGLSKCSLSSGVITIDSSFPVLATGDVVHIQFWLPQRAYDPSLDIMKVVTQNAQTTDVETLVSEADIAGSAATADAGGDTDTIVDADGAFSVASCAVGFRAWQTTDSQSALVSSVDSATTIQTGTLSGAATWASKAYRLPLVKRYEIPMGEFGFLTLHYYLRNGASLNTYLQIWGTLNSDANVDSDSGWVNLSGSLLGSSDGVNVGASATKEDIVIIDTKTPMLKYMVKLVVECSIATTPDNDNIVYIKKSK